MENELSFFSDGPETTALIQNICSGSWNHEYTLNFDRITSLLCKYQEQPILLNPVMPQLMDPLTTSMVEISSRLRSEYGSKDVMKCNETQREFLSCEDSRHLDAVCKYIQLVCRVRGFKHTTKLFPHDVSQLELCMFLLKTQVSSVILYFALVCCLLFLNCFS